MNRARARARIGSDDGSILPLIAVFVALVIALVLVVAAGTSLYLERKRLFSLADGAALAGAESFDPRRSDDVSAPVARLDDADVRDAAVAYLDASPRSRIEDLRLERAGTPDGRSAAVTLSGTWRPPVVALFVPDGLRLEVTASARGVFR